MNSHLLPTDSGWTEDKALMADLSHLNTEITRYVMRYLDADAGRVEPISVDDEVAFGQRLIDLGERVQQRATLRAVQATRRQSGQGAIEDAQPRALDSGRGSDMDHGP